MRCKFAYTNILFLTLSYAYFIIKSTQCVISVSKDEEDMSTKDELIELRQSTGMNRKQFCDYFQIPYRTMTDWELGNRTMPDYLLRLMAYKVNVEKLAKNCE